MKGDSDEEIIFSFLFLVVFSNSSIAAVIATVGNKSLNDEDVFLIVKQLTDFLNTNQKFAKIGDILNAINLGSFGEFTESNEVLYVSAANIFKWIKKYDEKKMEALSKQMRFEQEQKAKEEEEQKSEESKKSYYKNLAHNIKNANEQTCKIGWLYFESLWKLGLLKLSKEEIDAYKKKAKELTINELRSKRVSLTKIGDVRITTIANKKAKEAAFFDWQNANQRNNIEELINENLKLKKLI